ncbi:ABC transporter permease [Nesterenkonia haasae]|uniref:ABC transporter permease n=1 Tax=Nesterenkonia haasae TaxID=2587813 RepID=UPI0013920315|nr:ABC transporter permease [Nesterenkonia haasae]NDK32188.1 ABC transporter permease [Nesterenkonia haasae]
MINTTISPTTRISRPSGVLVDIWCVFLRELRPMLRDPFQLLTSLVQPLIFMAIFGPLLAGVTGESLGETYQWFVPGVLVMSTLFSTTMTGSNLLYEIIMGSHERMMVAPVSRAALLLGRTLKEMVPLLSQAIVLCSIAAAFGFRPHLPGLLTGFAILSVLGMGLGALSYALGIASRHQDWLFWAVQQTLIFPLTLLSGLLLPLEGGPRWIETVSQANPLTYVVDALRELVNGSFGADTLQGAVAAVVVLALGLVVGIRAMRRSV